MQTGQYQSNKYKLEYKFGRTVKNHFNKKFRKYENHGNIMNVRIQIMQKKDLKYIINPLAHTVFEKYT